jgi:histone deacetylase 11
MRYQTGGTILAALLALDRQYAINIGGGFHHASANSGSGFCVYADITLAIQFLFLKALIEKAMIIDLDAHQGNGHELDFLDDNRVYIFDMFNYQIFPNDFRAKGI